MNINYNEPKIANKLIKRDFNKLGLAMLMKEIIMYAVVFIFALCIAGIQIAKNPNITHDELINMLNNGTYNGTLSIIAVISSFIPFLIYRGRAFFEYDLRVVNKKFNFKIVVIGLIVLLSLNSLLVLFSNLLELGLNTVGFSASSALEDLDTLNQVALPMIIYSCILGPVFEEFIYRGVILRSLQKYGNRIAILLSAILFGLMHGNFYQIFMAVGLGIILGYLATEYSIKLTILLHIANNVSVQVLSNVSPYIGPQAESIINFGMMAIGLIVLMFYCTFYKNHIRQWLEDNRTQKGILIKFFTSILIILGIAIDLFRVIGGINTIS